MMMNKFYLFAFIFSFFSVRGQEINQGVKKRIYYTKSIENKEPPKIDGIINDPVWSNVEWSSDYLEDIPDNGSPPTEQTKMKIIYDSKNLYVAFKCNETDPSTVDKRMGRRDDFAGDWVEVTIGSLNDQRTAYSFTVSASGVKGDVFISNNNNFDTSWNPIWYVKTNIDEEGWTAEMRIPLSQLRFSASDEQVWALQSRRRYFKNEERSLWQPIKINPPGWVSEFGQLRGIKGLKPQKQLEIQPYVVGQFDTFEQEQGNPFRDGSNQNSSIGLDAKIGVTNDLTLDLAINPDFGQVDADPGAITLDGFEIFFQERRPFFVENKNIFDFRFGRNRDNLFFSRRIGRTPQGSTTADSNKGEFVDVPKNSTILGAAKFSGKTKNGWSVGVLESITDKEFAQIRLNTDVDVLNSLEEVGIERKEQVEPLTNYFVGRVQKDFNNRNSFIGGIFTATNRNLTDGLSSLRKSAYSGGLDFNHNWKNRKYYLEGSILFSNVNGTPEAIKLTQESITHLFQREDADHVEVDPTKTSLTGSGGEFEIGKNSGNWQYSVGTYWRSPELELNDIGFLRQSDLISQYFNINRNFNIPTNWYRKIELGISQFTLFDFEGNHNRLGYDFEFEVDFKNNWSFDAGITYDPVIFSNSNLRGGPRYRFSSKNSYYFSIGTDSRKKFILDFDYSRSKSEQDNSKSNNFELRFRYQPFNSFSISISPEYSKGYDKTQYISQVNFNNIKRYIGGKIKQESLSATLRVNYSINPNLTIQYYGQPFVFKARYDNFNYVNNPIAKDLNERFRLYDSNQISSNNGVYLIDDDLDGNTDYSFENPDFAFVQFRSNLVIRWEYIPGSELFLVWSQGITNTGNPSNRLGNIINNQLFNQKPENTFLIKATYRFAL